MGAWRQGADQFFVSVGADGATDIATIDDFRSGEDKINITLYPPDGESPSDLFATLDGNGNGRGTLFRLKAYGFNAAVPAACPATTGGAVLATGVVSCRFLYSPNQGATQQNGFVSLQLELARNGERASLVMGAHVVNAP